jgi:hypothetical protein
VVLHGIYYRGGANNRYHRSNQRDNRNPLPSDGLTNLCEAGFSGAVYFYTRNFSTAPDSVACETALGASTQPSTLKYQQRTAMDQRNHHGLLQQIHSRIRGETRGPLYGHCWNGWHASGLIASLALRQFCDWGADEALRYWETNTDGHDRGYQSIKKMIRTFKPHVDLAITPEERALICP